MKAEGRERERKSVRVLPLRRVNCPSQTLSPLEERYLEVERGTHRHTQTQTHTHTDTHMHTHTDTHRHTNHEFPGHDWVESSESGVWVSCCCG